MDIHGVQKLASLIHLRVVPSHVGPTLPAFFLVGHSTILWVWWHKRQNGSFLFFSPTSSSRSSARPREVTWANNQVLWVWQSSLFFSLGVDFPNFILIFFSFFALAGFATSTWVYFTGNTTWAVLNTPTYPPFDENVYGWWKTDAYVHLYGGGMKRNSEVTRHNASVPCVIFRGCGSLVGR